ncbi:release factor glutamine methyltransferase [Bizionia echini]|uniref:Release factor glutamine methyltransferase n=1 Tax=Bizionia echini TaxID=649333 RepID=A0A1I5BX62_9FLAO|nr:peptide chain release factor N(5)-glutamine methyltransferase [Bizionia echini]SFN79250.1 release factor glutamine methyltransferase [Bizionia echini]
MILKDIQNIFHQELDSIYGTDEVRSFFNILIDFYLGLNRITLVLEPNYTITKEEEQPLFEALSRLKLEEPIQHIIGKTEFYGLPFKLNKHTLIPRPETEELVDWILKSLTGKKDQPLKLLDIGTGTGCIAISLAKHLPNAHVYAVDVSPEAIKVAQENAKWNNVSITYIEDSILDIQNDILKTATGFFDVIVSNPPYVRNLEKVEIKNNVLQHEPHLALFVKDDNPLQFYEAISDYALSALKENGLLFFEINQYLGAEMETLLKAYTYKSIELNKDMFGNQRMLKGMK